MDEIEDNLPSNSIKKKVANVELPANSNLEKRRKVQGHIRTTKKSLGTRFAETFLGDGAHKVGDYILTDVVIPAIKDMLSDAFAGGIEMLLYGDRQSRRGRTRGSTINSKPPVVSYTNFFQNQARPDPRSGRKPQRIQSSGLDELYVENARDGDIVLEALDGMLEQFKVVTVADLKEIMSLDSVYTDNAYGWTDLSDAKVVRDRNGLRVNLPKAVRLT